MLKSIVRNIQSLPPANEVWGKVVFLEACVKNSAHRGGLPQCMLGYHPQDQAPPGTRHPPRPGTPWDQAPHPPPGAGTPPRLGTFPPTRHPPPRQSMLGGTVNEQAVRILLECNLVGPIIDEVMNARP